jgi:hypothetical protein
MPMPPYMDSVTTPTTSPAQAQRLYAGKPLTFFFGAGIVLFGLKVLSEHPNTAIKPAHMNIGPYNAFTILLTFAVGMTVTKLGLNWLAPNSSATAYVNWL